VKTNIRMKKFLAILGSALVGLMHATAAYAIVQPVTAEVTFAGPISIAPQNQLQFGVLDEALNTEVITIDTNDLATGSGIGFIIGGTQLAADLEITATALVPLSILVDAIIPGTGYTLDTFVCSYEGGAETDCDGPGTYQPTSVAIGTLKIGATLTGNTFAVAGNADGSFNVTVIYQ